MKDFAGSSITYFGLARERMENKYPRLVSVLLILTLVSMTGLAIFLISDLVSFASNPEHKGVLVGLDLKGPESGIASVAEGKEKSRNLVVLESEKQNNGNGTLIAGNYSPGMENSSSQINASLPSIQAAKGVATASKSSNSSSRNSVDEKSGNSPAKKHHSSSSTSSSSYSPSSSLLSSSSPAMSANNSTDMNNKSQEGTSSEIKAANVLAINETAESMPQTSQSMNSSQGNESEIESATVSSMNIPPVDAANSALTDSSNLSNEPNPTEIPASLPSDDISEFANPSKDTPVREPVAIIHFKTNVPPSQKSDQGLTGSGNSELSSNSGTNTDSEANADSQANAKSATADSRAAPQQDSIDAQDNSNSQAIGTESASSQESKGAVSSQDKKATDAQAEQTAKRNQMAESMRKKAEQMRAKASMN